MENKFPVEFRQDNNYIHMSVNKAYAGYLFRGSDNNWYMVPQGLAISEQNLKRIIDFLNTCS